MSKPEIAKSEKFMRPVRSFVRREGRVTNAQSQAIDQLWPKYGFEPHADELIDASVLFGRSAPLVLEIGFGDGEALVDIAGREPGFNFIGVEVYTAGVGHCLMRIEEERLDNVRLCREDAVELLKQHISNASLSELRLFFPDPWPKKKHHKRRIVNAEFCELLCQKLAPGGRLHFATDWAPYVLDACPCLENTAGAGNSLPRPAIRSET